MTINNKTLITLITLLILSMIFSVGCAKSNNTSSMDDNVMHIDASSLETDTFLFYVLNCKFRRKTHLFHKHMFFE